MDLRQWILVEHGMIQPLFRMNITSAVPADKLAVKPANGSNSIAWLVWHLARIEDVVVNSVARGVPQVLVADEWGPRLGVGETQIGTGLNDDEVDDFSRRVDASSLLEYWDAVQKHTQSWLSDVSPDELDIVPNLRERLEAVPEVVSQQAGWVLQIWANQPVSFFLRWVTIGHGYLHLGEMQAVRGQLGLRGL